MFLVNHFQLWTWELVPSHTTFYHKEQNSWNNWLSIYMQINQRRTSKREVKWVWVIYFFQQCWSLCRNRLCLYSMRNEKYSKKQASSWNDKRMKVPSNNNIAREQKQSKLKQIFKLWNRTEQIIKAIFTYDKNSSYPPQKSPPFTKQEPSKSCTPHWF